MATGLVPGRALLNDVNPHVINFYQWLKKGLVVGFEMANDERSHYYARERFNELDGPAGSHGDKAVAASEIVSKSTNE